MEVTRNAPAIHQHTEPLLISSSVAEFQRDGRLTRESLSHVEIGVGEGCVRGDPAGHNRTRADRSHLCSGSAIAWLTGTYGRRCR